MRIMLGDCELSQYIDADGADLSELSIQIEQNVSSDILYSKELSSTISKNISSDIVFNISNDIINSPILSSVIEKNISTDIIYNVSNDILYSTELSNIISSDVKYNLNKVYKFQGAVDFLSDLDELSDEASNMDVYNVRETGYNYAWLVSDNKWDNIGGIFKQSDYISKESLKNKIDSLDGNSTINNLISNLKALY